MRKKKLLALVLSTAMVFSLTGCGSKGESANATSNANTTPASESQEAAAPAGIYTPGTYKASAQGFGGMIHVTVTVDDNHIVSVEAVGDDETPDVGGKVLDEIAGQIVEADSTDIDASSSASYSSEAIIEATNKALAIARGEAEPASGIVADGKYVTESIGHEGTVTVETFFQDGQIQSIDVLDHGETQGIGTYAVERMPNRIVEAQSLSVDTVSGATITSNAIKQAVSSAIENAGGNLEDFNQKFEKAPVEAKTVEENVQVAIMGAGTSGLFAASQLLEKGVKDVLIFEKQDIPGGTMPVTYGGMLIAGSDIYDNWGLGSDTYASWDVMKANYTAYLDAIGQAYDPEFPFMGQMFRKSGEMYDWLSNIGVGFSTMGTSGFDYPVFAPGVYQGGSGYAMEFLVKRIEAKGGRIIYGTPVTDLVQDENGRITGLVAEGKEGTTWHVNADAVMLASGSFAKNQDLLKEYFPEIADQYFNTISSSTGDGLVLGMKYGAGIEDMGAEVPGFLASYDSHLELAFMYMTVPGLTVNVNGDEFANVVRMNHKVMAEAKADPANGDTFYYVFDDAGAVLAKNSKRYGFDAYKGIFEKGEAVHYDSVEACSQALNLPDLQATIDKNNELSLAGEANEWGSKNLPYVDTRDGVWAVRVDPNYYLTTGGLRIDTSAHVLTQEGTIIPGLYAAGDVVGSIEQKDGVTYGYGFDAAMSYGAVAAETMADDVK